jgi:hypothetical protein
VNTGRYQQEFYEPECQFPDGDKPETTKVGCSVGPLQETAIEVNECVGMLAAGGVGTYFYGCRGRSIRYKGGYNLFRFIVGTMQTGDLFWFLATN